MKIFYHEQISHENIYSTVNFFPNYGSIERSKETRWISSYHFPALLMHQWLPSYVDTMQMLVKYTQGIISTLAGNLCHSIRIRPCRFYQFKLYPVGWVIVYA